MKEHECFIDTRNHDLFETKQFESIRQGWNDRDNCKVLYIPDSEYNKTGFEKVIREKRPDLIYLQGLFQPCVFPCLQLAKKYIIPVLLAPRGELCAGALNIKKWKKMPYIEVVKALGLVRNIHWQSTSDEETEAIKELMKADDDHIHRLDNIPSIPKHEYPMREKIAGEGRFVFLSRIHPKKNLLFAISLFKGIEGKAEFDIYGPIEDEEYWKQCQEEIKKLPENVKVEYKGLVDHDQVHEVFSQYDAFLFPTLSENYGHVIAESLIVGTPVIISDQTPWRELEGAGAGWDIALDDRDKYIEAINKIIQMTQSENDNEIAKIKKYVEARLKKDELYERYMRAIYAVGMNK
jgi:glycosyltransferase involved in cell wall biosynthesis